MKGHHFCDVASRNVAYIRQMPLSMTTIILPHRSHIYDYYAVTLADLHTASCMISHYFVSVFTISFYQTNMRNKKKIYSMIYRLLVPITHLDDSNIHSTFALIGQHLF